MYGVNASAKATNVSEPTFPKYSMNYIHNTVLITLSVLIVLSNLTVLVLYQLNSHLRSKKNFLLASFALSDLSAGLVVLPVTLMCFQCPACSTKMCLSSAILFRFLAISTILHILAITFEKYFSIIHPLHHLGAVQKKHIRLVTSCIWGTSIAVSLSPLTWLTAGFTPDVIRKELIYFAVTFLLFFVLPLAFIIFAHLKMFKTISRSLHFISNIRETQLNSMKNPASSPTPVHELHYSSKNKKALCAFILMLGTFVASWFTWYLGAIFFYLRLPFSTDVWGKVLEVMLFLPFLINPMLYTYYKQDFRLALQSFFKRCIKIQDH